MPGLLDIANQIGRGLMTIYDENVPTMGQVRGLLGASSEQKAEVSKEDAVKNILSSLYGPEVVAGIMGNISVETGGSFDPTQRQKGGPGRGLFQMEGGMLNAYNRYIKNNELPNNAETQINFINNVLSGDSVYDIGAGHRKALRKAFASGSPEIIAREFSNRVLRPGKPHMDRRIEAARGYAG